MLTGDRSKTVNYTLDYWWETSGQARDRSLGNNVAAWIGQNARVLDKKRSDEVVKELVEQFPYLQEVEARHIQLQSARWKK